MAREGIVSSKGKHKRTRVFQGATGRRPDNKKVRVDEAKERQEAWAKLSPQEQLKALDRRPGESKKQRARLLAQIDAPRPTKKVAKVEEPATVSSDGGGRLKAKDRKASERAKRPGADVKNA